MKPSLLHPLLSCLFLGFLGGSLHGADFETVTAEHAARLEVAIGKLNTQREEIRDAQLPLFRRLAAARDATLALREEFAQRRSVQDSKLLGLKELESRVASRQQEIDYITRTLFGEYFAAYEAVLSPGERESHGQPLRDLYLYEESAEATESGQLAQSLMALEGSLARVRSVLGGKRYAGDALDPAGVLVSGEFLQLGPTLYFVGDDAAASGIVEEGAELRPYVRPMKRGDAARLAAFAQGQSDLLPIDPSLENAFLLAQTRESVVEHLRKGGIWVYPILFFAALATIVALYKFFQIFTLRQPDPLVAHELTRHLRDNDPSAALALAARQPPPSRQMLVCAVEHADEPIELIEEVMYESMLGVQPRLERFLNVIAVTAATAPLLGLLGTVTGIIKTFKLMNVFGAGDPKPLIAGISEALITTELGLVLAIPAMIIHALLSRKVAGVMARMEKLSLAFVNSLARRREGAQNG